MISWKHNFKNFYQQRGLVVNFIFAQVRSHRRRSAIV